tara:strand:+ start:118 stop:522 length:405 start_codon:yes stop_codon:yes gene_type:complete
MSKYCEITVKNHKKYNRKIVFLIFNDCSIEDSEEVDKIATEYHKIVKENPSISSIIDARNVKSCSKSLAFNKAQSLKKYEDIVKENLTCMAIILDNPVLKMLMDAVTRIQPFVVPTSIVKENKEAIEFVINQIK